MREKIEIEGDQVRLLRLTPSGEWTRELVVPLAGFLDLLKTRSPDPWQQQPLLPPSTRWYGHSRNADVLVLEDPPTTRRIRFAPRIDQPSDKAPEATYVLSFPYVVYVLYLVDSGFEEMKVFYRPAPLDGLDSELFLVNCFNVQLSRGHRAYSRACLRPKPEVDGLPIHQQAERLRSYFWDTEFNLDIRDSGFEFYRSQYPAFADLDVWQQSSREDPLFVLDFPWQPASRKLREVVEFFMDLRPGHWLPHSSRNLGDLCHAVRDLTLKQPRFDPEREVWRT